MALVSKIIAFLVIPQLVMACSRPPELVKIADLKSHPLQYDGKIVRVQGWLISGHIGIFAYDDGRQNSIRVRHPEEMESKIKEQVTHDKVFDEFWNLTDHEILKSSNPGIHVEFEALVRVLKEHGKPAKEFSLLGQFPIELVPIRVLEVEKRSLPR